MSSSYQKISAFLGVSLSVFFGSCTSTNVEELYQTNDQEARQIYNSELKEVIENKCISCHIFHLEGTNRYDNFEKTKSSTVWLYVIAFKEHPKRRTELMRNFKKHSFLLEMSIFEISVTQPGDFIDRLYLVTAWRSFFIKSNPNELSLFL